MLRICIVALIGLPAAGKTSFCNWLLSVKQNHFNVIHLCYDNFFDISTDTNIKTQKDYKNQRLEIFNILSTLVHSLKSNKSFPNMFKSKINYWKCSDSNDQFLIVCDDNHFYRSMRYKLYQFCRENGLAFAQIHIACSLKESLKRNAKRIGIAKLPNNVIEEMEKRFELPNGKQYSWEQDTLILEMFDIRSSDNTISFLLNSFKKVLKPLMNESKSEQSQKPTTIHQLDLLLRQHIKELIKNESTASKKERKALLMNAKRKEILQNLKESKIIILDKELSGYVKLL